MTYIVLSDLIFPYNTVLELFCTDTNKKVLTEQNDGLCRELHFRRLSPDIWPSQILGLKQNQV